MCVAKFAAPLLLCRNMPYHLFLFQHLRVSCATLHVHIGIPFPDKNSWSNSDKFYLCALHTFESFCRNTRLHHQETFYMLEKVWLKSWNFSVSDVLYPFSGMSLADLDPEEIRQEMETMTMSETDKSSATRTLKNLNQEVTPENVKLVCAAKNLLDKKKGVKSRLTPMIFEQCKKEVVNQTKVGRTLFMVPKANIPDLDASPQIQKWLEKPEDFDLPDSLDVETWYLLDSGCPRHLLGKGVHEIEVSVATQKRYSINKSSGSGRLSLPSTTQATSTAPNMHVPKAAAPSPVRPQRVLTLTPSEPADDVETIALSCKREFERNNLTSPDPNIPTAAYWIRCFSHFVTNQFGSGTVTEEQKNSLRAFPKFVASQAGNLVLRILWRINFVICGHMA